ncbi:SusD/RagB family nutrient-binding outer membrane lipoprotein, partial [Pseudoxanthomonas sp. SGD-10]
MKNRFKTLGVACLLAVLTVSCKKDFEEINTDPVNTPNALPEQLLAPALVSTVNANMIRNRNFNNELMQVTVSISDGDATVFRYEFRRTFSDYLWNNWYVQLTNFKDLYTQASNPLTLNKSYQGISLICQSWIYSMLTDTYGDVPYSESNLAREGIKEPKFDSQKDIYTDIFAKLEQANELLKSGVAIPGNSDPVFNGNVSKWRKFGNSLYLRLLLRVSGKSEVSALAIEKIKEIVETKASTYPIMANNDDSAILRWTGVAPYTSPYIGVREQDF